MYNEFHMPSVSLAVSVSELQSGSDARPIITGSCSSSTAISFSQYAPSTDNMLNALRPFTRCDAYYALFI